jgi:hypothetical protein
MKLVKGIVKENEPVVGCPDFQALAVVSTVFKAGKGVFAGKGKAV